MLFFIQPLSANSDAWPTDRGNESADEAAKAAVGSTVSTHKYLLSGDSQPLCDECKCSLTVKHMQQQSLILSKTLIFIILFNDLCYCFHNVIMFLLSVLYHSLLSSLFFWQLPAIGAFCLFAEYHNTEQHVRSSNQLSKNIPRQRFAKSSWAIHFMPHFLLRHCHVTEFKLWYSDCWSTVFRVST